MAVRVQGTGASPRLHHAAAALSLSVLADSSMEHHRGGFYNRWMYAGPAVAALTLAASMRAVRPSGARRAIFGAASAAGLLGTSFHLYNILRREGGMGWLNLFYAAPLGAPLGITFAGIFGLAAERLRDAPPDAANRRAGRLLGLASAAGLMGTAAEAGLLHFRGAFQDPFMYVPVTVPPLAALAVAGAAVGPERPKASRLARALLRTTAAAGLVGAAFHAYGVHRNMGGWRNWSQLLQQGPPLPAPPSFTGMALAGLAALELLEGGDDG